MKLFVIVIFSTLLSSCHALLIDTQSNDTKIENKHYCYENDTIKIVYDFWNKQGVMGFTITNKLKTPLYIDWKKSSFLLGSNKLDYWRDVEYGVNTGIYGQYSLNNVKRYAGITMMAKPERISFIPPGSKMNCAMYTLIPSNSIPNEEEVMYDSYGQWTYEQDNSVLSFSNFLTYSTNENFKMESYIHNHFFASRMTKIYRSEIKVLSADGQTPKYYKPTSFFIYLPGTFR